MEMKHLQQIPQEILDIFHTLQQQYEVYFVGGCVRDAYLNRKIHDYDCTTSATPTQMKEVLSHYKIIETGIKHGTLTIINNHQQVEITTFRKESCYHNHRSPNHISFSKSLKEDCMRRDFTMNALAYDGNNMIDYFDGIHDIENKIIRCIGHPQTRFEEDALRILRAVRFSLQLDFKIEENTRQALNDCLPLIQHLSIERCRDELFSMLLCQHKNIYSTLYHFHLLPFFHLIIQIISMRKLTKCLMI